MGPAEILQDMTALQMVIYTVCFLVITQTPLVIKLVRDKFTKKEECKDDGVYTISKFQLYRYDEVRDEVQKLKDDVLPTQMSVVNKANIRITNLLMDNYRTLKSPPRDENHYGHILFKTMHDTKTTLKQWLEYNHIAEKTDLEYMEYTKEIKDLLTKQHIDLLTKEYNTEYFTVSRIKLYKSNMENLQLKFDEILSDMMVKVRDISIKAISEIENLEKEKEDILKGV